MNPRSWTCEWSIRSFSSQHLVHESGRGFLGPVSLVGLIIHPHHSWETTNKRLVGEIRHWFTGRYEDKSVFKSVCRCRGSFIPSVIEPLNTTKPSYQKLQTFFELNQLLMLELCRRDSTCSYLKCGCCAMNSENVLVWCGMNYI